MSSIKFIFHKMSSTYKITNLGDISAHSIAYDTTKSAISVPQLTATDTFATLGAEQTLTNKTLTTPIIASLRNASGNGLITTPSSTSATTLATLELAEAFTGVKTLTSPVLTDGTHNLTMPTLTADRVIATTDDLSNADSALKGVIDRLIDYLTNWINVGNLSMSDIRTTVDTGRILPHSNQ